MKRTSTNAEREFRGSAQHRSQELDPIGRMRDEDPADEPFEDEEEEDEEDEDGLVDELDDDEEEEEEEEEDDL